MTLISEPSSGHEERILVMAERLFRELGYQKTTVGDIAKALHMTRPTCIASSIRRRRSMKALRVC